MKNLMKIFMAVMAGVFALSCVTDTTEDLAIEFGKGEGDHITKLPLSLEQSRTQLDEKAGDLYPVVWSENDAIAVNGVASMPLVAEQAGSSSAVFSLLGELERPFNVVYPAPAADVEPATEGLYPVTFLATQEYVSNSFCNGAAPMYGYAAAVGDKIEMHHLAGVLRLAVKGNGEAITRLVVKAQSGKIAGNFDVNCKTGELTPHRGASNVVTMPIESGLTLGAEATHFYVAIPAGLHGVLFVTLHTATDKMTVTVNSDLKPVVAGSVREFKEFTYGPNDINTDGDIFEIDGVDALMQFATLSQDFHPYTVAEVTEDIDMTGIDWTPIENFNGYTFNGGNFEIKGLNAPLFGTTTSTIKNVNLVDVNIASNGRLVLGAVACASDGITLNCKVSGNITVNNAEATIASGADAYTTVNYGGVVGRAGGDVIGCVNEANITVNQVANSDNTVAVHPIVGGVVGYSVAGAITNCVNGNEAKTAGAINYHDTHATQLYTPHVGGVAGSGASDNIAAFHNNTNYGAIDFLANTAGTGELSRNSTTIGGVIASSFHNVENNDNYGTITVSGGNIKGFILGGVVGTTTPAVRLYNCHNHQGANITVDSDVAFWAINVAGVVGTFGTNAAKDSYVDTCTNDAPIHVKASTDTNATANGSQLYRVGGVITYTNNTVKNCENKANGDITVEGNITLLRANNQPGYGVVGVSCYHTSNGTATNLINRGDINVYTNVTPTATWNTTTTHMTYGKIDIAGVCGYDTKAKRDFQNYGNITIGRAESPISITGNGLHIGGLVSYYSNTLTTTNLTENINKGKITIINATLCGTFTPTIGETANTWTTCIGGIAAYPTGNLSNSKNEGAVSLDATTTIATAAYIGGVSGKVVDDTLSAVKNSGAMTIGCTTSDIAYIGGIVGNTTGAVASSENSGAINISGTCSTDLYAGGVVGYTTATELSGVKNNVGGAMTIGGTINGQSYIGGITGTYAGALTSCENHGNILFNGTCASNKHFYIAGITGYSTSTAITSCLNTGDITIDKCGVSSIKIGEDTYEYMVCLSGIVGYQATNVTTFKNCSNSGTLQITNNVSSNFVTRVGGILGGTNKSITLDNCHNSMKAGAEYGIILKHTTTTGVAGSNQARAGGLIGWQHGGTLTTKNGVSNSANCYFGCINKDSGGSSYGGIAGVLGGNAHSFGGTISNSGNLHYAGASHAGTFSIGGLFGQSGNKAPTLCEDLQNTGNITVEKTNNNWKPTAKKHGYIGGVIGIHSVALSNAKSVCTITAIGFEDTHTVSSTNYFNTVGGVVGATSSANLTNCHVGGLIILTDTNTPGALSVSNYAAYLSGDHTFDAATAKTQECGFITSIDDTTPEYAE